MGAPLRAAAVALAALVVLVVVLAVAFAFIGIYRLAEYNAKYSTVRAPRYRLSEVYPRLKTGDLVLFVATTHAPANSMLTQTFHSHAGVLLREGELVYVAEAQPALELMPDPGRPGADIRMRHGADITPLLTRLKYYTGDYYVLRLARPLGPAAEEALKREAEHLRRAGPPYPSAWQILLGVLGRKTRSRHCFQHVARLLDVAGLAPAGGGPLEAAGFSGVCAEVCGIAGRPLPGGNAYRPPAQLVYDLDAAPPSDDEGGEHGGCEHEHGGDVGGTP